MSLLIPEVAISRLGERSHSLDTGEAERIAGEILADVSRRGESAVRAWSERLGDRDRDAPLYYGPADLQAARVGLRQPDRQKLERIAWRISRFAQKQRENLRDFSTEIDGVRSGHTWKPLSSAGCYAPGGRYPLPSSVLMTGLTAAAAGVEEIWIASPRPSPLVLAAASLVGARGVLATGGAQAIGALGFGCGPIPPVAIVVGPGNRFVDAAKRQLGGRIAIDSPAGPSELLVLSDAESCPKRIAVELIAQAEHDPDARCWWITTDRRGQIERVRQQLELQLTSLSTRAVATPALTASAVAVTGCRDEIATTIDRIAPEHLLLLNGQPRELLSQVHHYGAAFVGRHASVTLGDYGAGPNHVLPTSGAARSFGGLSVASFLRPRSWIEVEAAAPSLVLEDIAWLATSEGLEGHCRAAQTVPSVASVNPDLGPLAGST